MTLNTSVSWVIYHARTHIYINQHTNLKCLASPIKKIWFGHNFKERVTWPGRRPTRSAVKVKFVEEMLALDIFLPAYNIGDFRLSRSWDVIAGVETENGLLHVRKLGYDIVYLCINFDDCSFSYGSLKVTGNSAIRWSACEFLLAFHSNYVPIWHSFWDIARYWSKNRRFKRFNLPHLYFAPSLGVTPLEFRQDLLHQKANVPGLSWGVVHYEDMKGDTKCRNGVVWGS